MWPVPTRTTKLVANETKAKWFPKPHEQTCANTSDQPHTLTVAESHATRKLRRAQRPGPCLDPGYLYSAAELTDRAAELAADSAELVHDNEPRLFPLS